MAEGCAQQCKVPRRHAIVAVTRAAVFFLAMVVVVAILMRQAAEVRVELADSSLEKQLAGAQKMFADEKPVPASSGHHHHGPTVSSEGSRGSRGRRRDSASGGTVGLGGMSQRAFMHRVDSAVTHKVAQELLATIRPLKRILREQQGKIEKLQKQKRKEKAVEETLARSLANKLKSGLLSHLKRDVDIEVRRKLTPKALLKYEKSKAALRRKLQRLHAEGHVSHKDEREEGAPDVAKAAQHTMSSALRSMGTPTDKDAAAHHVAVAATGGAGASKVMAKAGGEAHGRKTSKASKDSAVNAHAQAHAHHRHRQHAAHEPPLTHVQANVAKEISNAKGTVSEGSKRRERKDTSAQEEVAQEIAKAKGLSSSKHGKGRKHCDPLAGLFKSGLVSPC